MRLLDDQRKGGDRVNTAVREMRQTLLSPYERITMENHVVSTAGSRRRTLTTRSVL